MVNKLTASVQPPEITQVIWIDTDQHLHLCAHTLCIHIFDTKFQLYFVTCERVSVPVSFRCLSQSSYCHQFQNKSVSFFFRWCRSFVTDPSSKFLYFFNFLFRSPPFFQWLSFSLRLTFQHVHIYVICFLFTHKASSHPNLHLHAR